MRLAVLGDPVGHSLSPLLHSTALEATGLAGTYEARRVDAAGLAQAVTDIREGSLDGANVTMPYKEEAARLCDRLAATAAVTGAVNTLLRVGTTVVGHNTDIAGIHRAWLVCGLPDGAPVLVLGAGGAAAAAVVAVSGRDITVSARRPEAARRMVDRLAAEASVVPWGSSVPDAVVVNATPLGMGAEALPEDVLAAAVGLFDMTYGGGVAPAVRQMLDHDLPVAVGETMLLHQAAVAFELWTGRAAPLEAMKEALDGASNR